MVTTAPLGSRLRWSPGSELRIAAWVLSSGTGCFPSLPREYSVRASECKVSMKFVRSAAHAILLVANGQFFIRSAHTEDEKRPSRQGSGLCDFANSSYLLVQEYGYSSSQSKVLGSS